MADYETLFEEKLDLFVAVLAGKPVTWSGTTRTPLKDQIVYPPIEHGGKLKTWVGVGGTPGLGRPGRAPQSAAHARDHRRRSEAVRALRRSVSPRARALQSRTAADRGALARSRGGDRRTGARGALAASQGADDPHRRRAGLGAHHAGAVRPRRPVPTARSASARPRPSRRRSPRPFRRSASRVST